MTHDGVETDLDLGHYERFLDFETSKYSITLSGSIYKELIERERAGGFHGKTVQLVPHFTGLVCEKIEKASAESDIHIVEIGGTIGDYEGLPFVEAIRLFANKVGRRNCLYVSVVYVPFNVLKSGMLAILNDFVGETSEPDMSRWKEFSRRRAKEYAKTVRIGLVAKYVGSDDTYMCVTEALKAAAAWDKVNLELRWVNAEEVEKNVGLLKGLDGIVVPGGFGARGVEGKIRAAEYALEHDVPYLGLCLGLQVACIAAARQGGIKGANSEEFGADEKDGNNVIYIMEGQRGKESTDGTMRLGDYKAVLKPRSRAAKIYQKAAERGEYVYETEVLKDGGVEVIERHRHRYEVNQKFLDEIRAGGVKVSGFSPDEKLVEYVEAPECRFFVATQAHPEFKSRPLHPHPLFREFVKAAGSKK